MRVVTPRLLGATLRACRNASGGGGTCRFPALGGIILELGGRHDVEEPAGETIEALAQGRRRGRFHARRVGRDNPAL